MISPKNYLIFSLIWFTLILVLSVLPSSTPDTLTIDRFEFRMDYLLHFLIYLPLGYALMRWGLSNRNAKGLIYTIILLLLFSMLPEALQYIIPYRTFNPYDLLFNLAGTICGCLILIMIAYVRQHK